MKKFWAKFKCFWKELGNLLTNILCPFVTIIIAAMELLQLPISWISVMKKVEYWLFYASGTKKHIDKIIEKVDENQIPEKIDEAIEKAKEKSKEVK